MLSLKNSLALLLILLPHALSDTCSPGQHINVCSCHEDGVINGVDTDRTGCKKHTGGDFFCYISDSCPTGNSAPAFDGVEWKVCDPVVDGGGACEDCPAGYEGDGVVCTACKNSFSGVGKAECTDCPVDRPWAPEMATEESECASASARAITHMCEQRGRRSEQSGRTHTCV